MNFDTHLQDIQDVLIWLNIQGLKSNLNKIKWFHDTVNYLGYTLTTKVVKPQIKKIQALINMDTPKI